MRSLTLSSHNPKWFCFFLSDEKASPSDPIYIGLVVVSCWHETAVGKFLMKPAHWAHCTTTTNDQDADSVP
jgi:hypothetical protein